MDTYTINIKADFFLKIIIVQFAEQLQTFKLVRTTDFLACLEASISYGFCIYSIANQFHDL